MNKRYIISILLFSLILLSLPQTVFSQAERLAVVSTFNGEVRVQHDGAWNTVTKVGSRIRNSSVYNGDTVLTMPGAHVDLVFSDNSTIKVEADTTLTISTRQITAADREKEGFVRNVAGTRQEVVRNINVKVGKLWAHITPSKSVLTEFESPTGVASVRGTTLTFGFLYDMTTHGLIEGITDFATVFSGMYLNLDSGDSLSISDNPGETKVKVESGNGITFETSKGIVTIKGSLDVKVDPVTGEMTVVSATDVTITVDGTTTDVKPGDSLGIAMGGSQMNFGADVMGGGEGNTNVTGGGYNGPPATIPDPFFGTSVSQLNQTQQESSVEDDDEEADSDGDGVPDSEDAFPTDPDETTDTDGDLVGDNTDAFPNNPQTFWMDDFSGGNLDKWDTTTNAYVDTSFGPNIGAKSGDPNDKFAIVHTGNGNQADTGKLIKEFDFQVGGTRNVTFDYNFETTENPNEANTVITFDDVGVLGGANYFGLDWSSAWSHLNGSTAVDSGYKNGLVSGTEVAFNLNESDVTVSKSSGTWDFTGTYISAAWRDGLQVTFTGAKDGTDIFSETISVDYTGPNWQDLNFTDIDTLSISSTGGDEVDGLLGSGTNFALDNFTIGGSANNDYFKAELILSDGSSIELAYEDVYTSTLTAVADLPTTVLDNSSGYQTGWKSVDWTGFVPAGLTQLIFGVYDVGDALNDSAVLIDNVVDPLVDGGTHDDTQSTGTNAWMTFAQMIRDDIDVDDIDISAGFESNPEHQAYIDDVENALVDLEESPGSLNLADIFGNIWTEKDNLFDSEYTQHASVAMLLLTAKEIAESENSFEVNLNAIRNSLSLAKTFMENHINDFGDTVDMGIKVLINGILTKIDEVLDPSDIVTANTIKGDIKDAFCNIVNNLNHSNSMEEENPFHFCHGNMDEGS